MPILTAPAKTQSPLFRELAARGGVGGDLVVAAAQLAPGDAAVAIGIQPHSEINVAQGNVPLARHLRTNQPLSVSEDAQRALLAYPWPGNVRELENVMRRAMVLCTDHVVTPAHLMFDDWLNNAAATPSSTPAAIASSIAAATGTDNAHAGQRRILGHGKDSPWPLTGHPQTMFNRAVKVQRD